MPDRYSADEARRIFARAARRQHAAPTEDGLSVEELAEIGRAAGLDPALVAAEAASERLGDGHGATWHGVPVGIRRARLLPDRLSDREWERVVDLLRTEFKMGGAAQQIGTRREWATGTINASGPTSAAYTVRVEVRPDGDLVTVEAPRVSQFMGYVLGGTMVGVAVMVGGLVALLNPEKAGESAVAFVMILAVAAVVYVAAWLSAKWSAARTPARFEALLDRIDLLSRSESAAVEPAEVRPARAGGSQIDPAHLGAEAEAPAAAPARTRTRA